MNVVLQFNNFFFYFGHFLSEKSFETDRGCIMEHTWHVRINANANFRTCWAPGNIDNPTPPRTSLMNSVTSMAALRAYSPLEGIALFNRTSPSWAASRGRPPSLAFETVEFPGKLSSFCRCYNSSANINKIKVTNTLTFFEREFPSLGLLGLKTWERNFIVSL